MKLLVVVLSGILVVLLGLWVLAGEQLDPVGANGRLRGSVPPAGQRMPDLATEIRTSPRLPGAETLRGAPVVLAFTCYQCESGDRIGGFFGRLDLDDVHDDARLLVVGWGGDPTEWRSEWAIDDRVEIYTGAEQRILGVVRRHMGMDVHTSGVLLLHDRAGTWRSSFHVGQLDRDEVIHDVAVLADS